jgi:hypothetical protein
MDLLPERYKVVTATVDAAADEIGVVYQAAGFDYVGIMRNGGRSLTRINGKAVSERQMHRLAGTRGHRALAKLGFDAVSVPRKARYFAFRGKERRQLRAAIAHLLQPYPKRARASELQHGARMIALIVSILICLIWLALAQNAVAAIDLQRAVGAAGRAPPASDRSGERAPLRPPVGL